MKRSTLLMLLTILSFSFLHLNCKDDPVIPPDITAGFSLVVEDTTSTEVFLRLKFDTPNIARTISIKRDTITLFTKTLFAADTLIVDENLLPKHFYTYTVALVDKAVQRSVSTTTMDTTSHNWTWTLETFGDGASSSFYDVAIINDTLAYAVGEIYKKDFAGNFIYPPYNVAKWDGKTWELKRLWYNCRLYFPSCGPETLLVSPAHSIFAFNANDIWIAAGSIHHFDGTNWEQFAGVHGAGSANKIWGSSSSNMYFVGNNGFIVYYDGSSWQKLQSGTDLHIYDIYGSKNTISGNYEIYAVAANVAQSSERKILQINGSAVSSVSSYPIINSTNSVWFVPYRHYYLVGNGIHEKRKITDSLWKDNLFNITTFYTTHIRGNTVNDLFVVGAFGDCLHFNGLNWKNFRTQTNIQNGSFTKVAMLGNITIIVGQESPYGFIAIGKRF